MRTVDELLADVPVFRELPREHRDTVAGCARNAVYEAGRYLMREGEPADAFYVIREGAVALETFVPQRGAVTVQTLHEGDLLGWSWLFSPYRTAFDARVVETAHAIEFDGACLRGKCDSDPALGYDLLTLFAGVIVQRLQHTRMQLLNLYDTVPGS
jgi:CRP/FNR family transcriptional regulator, cyclic AMP receptor protein